MCCWQPYRPKGTLIIFYGLEVLQHADITPDKRKKIGFHIYFYFFLRHG